MRECDKRINQGVSAMPPLADAATSSDLHHAGNSPWTGLFCVLNKRSMELQREGSVPQLIFKTKNDVKDYLLDKRGSLSLTR